MIGLVLDTLGPVHLFARVLGGVNKFGYQLHIVPLTSRNKIVRDLLF